MQKLLPNLALMAGTALGLWACSENTSSQTRQTGKTTSQVQATTPDTNQRSDTFSSDRILLWGDTHLHTKYSVDAYALLNHSTTPDDAYRFARGLPVIHPYTKARVQLRTPLDFLVVSDHAEYMGVMQLIAAKDANLMATDIGQNLISMNEAGNSQGIMAAVVGPLNKGEAIEELLGDEIRSPIWNEIVDAAERNNRPGEFTTFIGWEWSSLVSGTNLHRVIFTPDGADVAKRFLPFSSIRDASPEGLWNWLESTQNETGARFVSIPHNSNLSLGQMFSDKKYNGSPIDVPYAQTRMEWEPVVEILQAKGSSETHPVLSPEDEFSGYEIYEKVLDITADKSGGTGIRGNYARDSLKRGLEIDGQIGANPYKFGMIGASDLHTGLSSVEENNFHGKYAVDSVPENKKTVETTPNAYGIDPGAQGLAGVWADENTRNGIFEAFRRKEVYATSGPQIKLRLFGGWDFKAKNAESSDLAAIGYRKGVPMGGDLMPGPAGKAPGFLVHAAKDPLSGNLDRIQIIKGWLNTDGSSGEKIYNAALSDDRVLSAGGTVPPVGNTVNLDTANFENSIGDVQLSAVWRDPDFDAEQKAFYYARVLEIPTPRHTLFDAVAMQQPHSETHKPFIQERAISSPIWYNPSSTQ